MAISLRTVLSIARQVMRVVHSSADTPGRARTRPDRTSADRTPPRPRRTRSTRGPVPDGSKRSAAASYSPSPDGRPDPGEIVWTWVPYEDDPAQGKDRPVLLIARDGDTLLGLMLTSRDHTNSLERDARYVDIGTGSWDRQGRPSEVKVDRILRIDPATVRREGAVLPRNRFEQVITALPDGLLD